MNSYIVACSYQVKELDVNTFQTPHLIRTPWRSRPLGKRPFDFVDPLHMPVLYHSESLSTVLTENRGRPKARTIETSRKINSNTEHNR